MKKKQSEHQTKYTQYSLVHPNPVHSLTVHQGLHVITTFVQQLCMRSHYEVTLVPRPSRGRRLGIQCLCMRCRSFGYRLVNLPTTWLRDYHRYTAYLKLCNLLAAVSMTSCFISRLASDGLPTNDYKDLNSHAYGLFKAGHVQSIFVSSQASKYDIKCVCLPEMRKDQVYNITLTMDSNADVLKSSCGSPAGAGPKGPCWCWSKRKLQAHCRTVLCPRGVLPDQRFAISTILYITTSDMESATEEAT